MPKNPDDAGRLDLQTPRLVDRVEWFASGPDLCRTFSDLAKLARVPGLEPIDAILSANPGLPPQETKGWNTTWFKGGSEPGVVALAYRLSNKRRDRVVVIALSNPDAPLAQDPEGERIVNSLLDRASQ